MRSPLPHGQLKDWHPARAKQTRVAHFANHRSHFAGAQFRNPARIQPVFIAKWQIIEQIADRGNALGGKNLRQPRTNSLDVLHRRGEFKHVGGYKGMLAGWALLKCPGPLYPDPRGGLRYFRNLGQLPAPRYHGPRAMNNIAVLYDAGQAVLSTFDLDEVLQRILAIARDYFHLRNVAILLLDQQSQQLYVRSQIGWDEGQDKIRMSQGQGITGAAALKKQPVYAPDVTQDPRYFCSAKSTHSELAIPLMVRDEVVGVLDCQSDRVNHFDSETIDLLTLFSTQASIALQNARLYSLEQQRARQLQAINAIAQQTTAVLDLEDLLSRVCQLIQDAFRVSHVSLLLREDHDLVLRAHHGTLTPRIPQGGRFPAEPWADILASNSTVTETDLGSAPTRTKFFAESASRMCIPLVSFGHTLGILALDSALPDAFRDGDLQSLESVADICATAIQNAHYVERVKQLAYLDGLTGIFNRRFFELRIRGRDRACPPLRLRYGRHHGRHRSVQAAQ